MRVPEITFDAHDAENHFDGYAGIRFDLFQLRFVLVIKSERRPLMRSGVNKDGPIFVPWHYASRQGG